MTCDERILLSSLRRLGFRSTAPSLPIESMETHRESGHGSGVELVSGNRYAETRRPSQERSPAGLPNESTNCVQVMEKMNGRAEDDNSNTATTSDGNQALLKIRNVLEEQKIRHALKRQRLVQMREASAAAEKGLVVPDDVRRMFLSTRSDDVNAITTSTFFESRDILDYLSVSSKEDVVFGSETNPCDSFDTSLSKEDSSSTSATSDVSSDGSCNGTVISDEDSRQSQALAEMKARVEALEGEKTERDRALALFFERYGESALKLRCQMEEEMIDCEETECSEMESLIVEQREESDYLRCRVSALEKRTKMLTSKIFRRAVVMSFIFACGAIAAKVVVPHLVQTKKSLRVIDWNGLCAPARPGTKITEETGPLEAPWWAPAGGYFIKAPLYHFSGCGKRPRTRIEVKRGMLHITANNGRRTLIKKPSKTAYVKAGSVHVVDNRYGGHVEIQAPWV